MSTERDPELLAYYRECRSWGLSASQALIGARSRVNLGRFRWLAGYPNGVLAPGDRPVQWTSPSGFQMRARVLEDNDADVSYLGEIKRGTVRPGRGYQLEPEHTRRGWERQYYEPCNGMPAGIVEYHRKAGMARGPAWERAEAQVRGDLKRLQAFYRGDWWMVGVEVTASLAGVALGTAALFGIECDVKSYQLDVLCELEAEAIGEAQEKLKALARHIPESACSSAG